MTGNRTIGLITAMCFALAGFITVPTFAESETSTTNSAVSISSPIQTDNSSGMNTNEIAISITGTAIGTTGTAISTTGAAISTTGPAIGTTSAAISTTGTAISTSGAAICTTGAAINTTGTALTTTPKAINAVKEESLWYLPQISMKKEHQKILWDFCKKRGVDYIDMLALIALESNFNEKCSSGKYKGYFQISTGHSKNLAATLNTPNKPLDGAVNINWGTALYSWALSDKRVEGLTGKKLRDAALSIYQRGTLGYDKYGINKSYLVKYYKKRDMIVSYFESVH